MKAVAINGSPRKGGRNTEILLNKVLAPLAAAGWEIVPPERERRGPGAWAPPVAASRSGAVLHLRRCRPGSGTLREIIRVVIDDNQ